MHQEDILGLPFDLHSNSDDCNIMDLDLDCPSFSSNNLTQSNRISWSEVSMTPQECLYHHHHHHYHRGHNQFYLQHTHQCSLDNLSCYQDGQHYQSHYNHQHPQSHIHQPSALVDTFQYSPELQKAIESILFIADHIKKEDQEKDVCNIN